MEATFKEGGFQPSRTSHQKRASAGRPVKKWCLGWWRSSSAVERMKKSEVQALSMMRQQSSLIPGNIGIVVPLQQTMSNILMPLPVTCDEYQVFSRSTSGAEAQITDMTQKSHLNTTHAQQQGLSALATELLSKTSKADFSKENEIGGSVNNNVQSAYEVRLKKCLKGDIMQTIIAEGEAANLSYQREDHARSVTAEVSESTKPRFKESKLKIPQKPVSKDQLQYGDSRDYLLQLEQEKQQDRRYSHRIAIRKKQVRYFRSLEGVGEVDDIRTTPPCSKADPQSIANFPIIENVEESARRYPDFIYKPSAARKNVDSDSVSSCSPGHCETEFRPLSCETGKSTDGMVLDLSSASVRRETLRKELAERIRKEALRKKSLLSQSRAASRQSQCQCH
ncbi:uncharacterized protein [Physcomitrium patens]|uniref:uncharacterized protein isoform X2 n=1 Tax=Physcomitrium patens TaxID=3218 RepID=UPI000D1673EF|nr:uncharacterized protein LOC112276436 isoform X2 [Physcomitrium patens]XP_024363519.1 uncharacterized protein LOC112276436 isoform X2 [Physcomitrium patens]XP_024363520.1 uncharacterized protein LOC112276436 isoform X2 [Physcomitrium patens]|eukprot:XP_024363518.1 uncharacterized protein LOC112276436 isoform X2 [Physcomitrella patens]